MLRCVFFRTLIGSLFLSFSIFSYDYRRIMLDEIQFYRKDSNVGVRDLDGSIRAIYKDSGNAYKIWSSNYKHRNVFEKAVTTTFFNNIASIEALIIDTHGNCRGYVCPLGQLALNYFPKEVVSYKINARKCYCNWDVQHPAFQTLVDNLIEATLKYGFIHIDFTFSNLIVIEDKAFLIDLESLITVDDFLRIRKERGAHYHFLFECLPTKYQQGISESLNRRYKKLYKK